MKRILVVDDGTRELQALRQALPRLEDEWAVEFASGAKEALGVLGQGAFDVVSSDFRMPGMDGAQFLSQVRGANPRWSVSWRPLGATSNSSNGPPAWPTSSFRNPSI